MIYLDYNATAPLRPEVFAAMKPFLTERWGNPSSSYTFGSKLKAEIEAARRAVAQLVNASASEVVFTGSATEADNTAINAALAAQPGKRHIITSAVEHSAVFNHCAFLESQGVRITRLPVDADGLLDLAALDDAFAADTAHVAPSSASPTLRASPSPASRPRRCSCCSIRRASAPARARPVWRIRMSPRTSSAR